MSDLSNPLSITGRALLATALTLPILYFLISFCVYLAHNSKWTQYWALCCCTKYVTASVRNKQAQTTRTRVVSTDSMDSKQVKTRPIYVFEIHPGLLQFLSFLFCNLQSCPCRRRATGEAPPPKIAMADDASTTASSKQANLRGRSCSASNTCATDRAVRDSCDSRVTTDARDARDSIPTTNLTNSPQSMSYTPNSRVHSDLELSVASKAPPAPQQTQTQTQMQTKMPSNDEILFEFEYNSRAEAFLKYGLDALMSVIMIKYLIGNMLIVAFKVASIAYENNMARASDPTSGQFESFCKWAYPAGLWLVVFSTWTLFMFMALRALQIELNRFGATLCNQLSPLCCTFGCVVAFLYHSYVVWSLQFELKYVHVTQTYACTMRQDGWAQSLPSRVVLAGVLGTFAVWGLFAFVRPVCQQRNLLSEVQETLRRETLANVSSNSGDSRRSAGASGAAGAAGRDHGVFVIGSRPGFDRFESRMGSVGGSDTWETHGSRFGSTREVVQQLKRTYVTVSVVGCVGYCLCMIGFWVLSDETHPYLLSCYILIHVFLFVLMASTFRDVCKILCAWRYYKVCGCDVGCGGARMCKWMMHAVCCCGVACVERARKENENIVNVTKMVEEEIGVRSE